MPSPRTPWTPNADGHMPRPPSPRSRTPSPRRRTRSGAASDELEDNGPLPGATSDELNDVEDSVAPLPGAASDDVGDSVAQLSGAASDSDYSDDDHAPTRNASTQADEPTKAIKIKIAISVNTDGRTHVSMT